MAKDYYAILGASKGDSEEEIKKAFRKKAHIYHPDKKGGDEAKFKEINEAYQVLSDKEKRAQYDQYGQTFEQAQQQGGGAGFGGGFGGFQGGFGGFGQGGQGGVEFDFGDVFSDFFGGGQKQQRQKRGRDIEVDVRIDFVDMITGVDKVVELNKTVTCKKCDGSGADSAYGMNTCKTCHGQGQIEQIRNTILGAIRTATTCPDCHGEGNIPERKCSVCHGAGVVRETEKITVKIPAGIDDGETIRITGKGEAIKGGQTGDIFINARVNKNAKFVRDDQDIRTTKHISLTQGILGDKVDIEIPTGNLILKIPEGTQSGKEFRLRGKGIPSLRGFGKGDLIVEVVVNIPDKLNGKQKKLIKELQDLGL